LKHKTITFIASNELEILSALLSLLAALAASAQIKFEFALPDSIVGKAYLHNYVRQALKDLGNPTTPTLPECDRGPDIWDVLDITSTGAVIQFDGENVTQALVQIFNQAGAPVFSETIKPASNLIQVSFGKILPAGRYVASMKALNCTGSGTRPFTIAEGGTGSEPVIPPAPPVAAGLYTLAKGMDTHMKLVTSQTSQGVLVTDESDPGIRPGYEYRYLVGGDLISQATPLKNYLVAGFNPFRIWKVMVKTGGRSVVYWGDKDWQDPEMGQGYTYNNSYAFQTFIYSRAQDPAGFLNHIPQGFDPARQVSQWADLAPDMKLPAGHVWIAAPQYPDHMKVIRKGVTHLPHHLLPWAPEGQPQTEVERLKSLGLTYNNVPRLEHIMNLSRQPGESIYNPAGYDERWWPNGALTKEQAIAKADQADISDAIFIGETEESPAHFPSGDRMWFYFWDRIRQRMDEKWLPKGIQPLICHNYYVFGYQMPETRQLAKAQMKLSPAQLPATDYSPGGSLSRTNLITEAIYLGAPDQQKDQLYNTIYKFSLWHNMGYTAGAFLFGVHEDRPNNAYQYNYKEGTFYVQDKIPLDPALHIANGFISQVFGDLFTEWGGKGRTDNNYFQLGFDGLWFDKGSDQGRQKFPIDKKGPVYYGYSGSEDLSYFSQKLFNDTYGQTDQGQRAFLKHRIDGGAWINPEQDGINEVIDAKFDARGFVHSQTKNGKTAWFYVNSYADNKAHTLDVFLPSGRTVTHQVAGIGIHVKID